MSKRTYVDSPHDATKGWTVEQDEKDGLYYVMVPDDVMCDCGCPNCRTVIEKKMRRHTAKWNTGEEDPEGLHETIEAVQGDLDDDYDRYVEENHPEIARQEMYEMHRREF